MSLVALRQVFTVQPATSTLEPSYWKPSMKKPQDTKPSKDDRLNKMVHISEVLKKILQDIGEAKK